MRALRFAMLALLRDWRSGELAVLLAALLVAVTALTGVGFFTDRIGQAVERRAAEVLAAGLGGNQRAGLVGGRTFGGASEQKLIPLGDGSAVVLSVAYYYTPAGKSIMDDGVQPTAAVRLAMDFSDDADDSATEAAAPQPRRSAPADDPVLRKALDLLKDTSVPKAA